eukprot:443953-Pyramimonas_sp.AAC.1
MNGRGQSSNLLAGIIKLHLEGLCLLHEEGPAPPGLSELFLKLRDLIVPLLQAFCQNVLVEVEVGSARAGWYHRPTRRRRWGCGDRHNAVLC